MKGVGELGSVQNGDLGGSLNQSSGGSPIEGLLSAVAKNP